ncbi:MAG: D-inositol-3-phosphate glycosyltransferase [Verrucomicrobiae bacterium]|nr:D-inositol-3-phosphate glycosyltransferase [Verrucomicrobiae bacterium]
MSRPALKFCLVTPSFPLAERPTRGGSTTYAEHLAKVLLQHDFEVHVVLYQETHLPAATALLAVKLHVITLRAIPYFSALLPGVAEAWQLGSFLQELDQREHFAAVEGANDEGKLLFAVRYFRERFVIRLHSSLRQHITGKKQPLTWARRFSVWLDKQTVRRCLRRVTHSHLHATEMAHEYGISVDSIQVFPHAVESPKPILTAPRPCIEQPVIIYIGTLDRRKGIDILLAAIPSVLNRFPQAELRVIGRDGGDSPAASWKDWFQATTSSKNSCRRVVFTGPVTDEALNVHWQEASLVVIPSRYESFGYILAEAFARGVPALATRGGALPEVARDGALLVEPNNPSALAEGAMQLLTDTTLASKLIARGHELYYQHYTLDRFGKNVIALHRQGITQQ